jgi:hypothetical protein
VRTEGIDVDLAQIQLADAASSYAVPIVIVLATVAFVAALALCVGRGRRRT